MEAVLPRVYAQAITGLSDDILLHIFRIYVDTSNDKQKAPFELSWVNHRFRTVALANGCLWSRMVSSAPFQITELSYQRARNSALDVEIRLGSSGDLDEFIGLVTRGLDRWRTLALTQTSTNARDEIEGSIEPANFDEPFRQLRNIHLPSLVSIDASLGRQTSNRIFELLKSWTVPQLSCLHLSQKIPVSLPRWMTTSFIKSFHLYCNYSKGGHAIPIVIIKSLPSLLELKLSLWFGNAGYDGDADYKNDLMSCKSIDTIKSFTLATDSRFVLLRFLSEIDMPLLETFSISFGKKRGRYIALSEWLKIPDNHLPNLKQLKFTLIGAEAAAGSANELTEVVPLGPFLSSFPALEELSICTPHCILVTPEQPKLSQSLRTLVIDSAESVDIMHLEALADVLKKESKVLNIRIIKYSISKATHEKKL